MISKLVEDELLTSIKIAGEFPLSASGIVNQELSDILNDAPPAVRANVLRLRQQAALAHFEYLNCVIALALAFGVPGEAVEEIIGSIKAFGAPLSLENVLMFFSEQRKRT